MTLYDTDDVKAQHMVSGMHSLMLNRPTVPTGLKRVE